MSLKRIAIIVIAVIVIAVPIVYLYVSKTKLVFDSAPKHLVIQPYGNFSPALVKFAEEGIRSKYNMQVSVLPAIQLPAAAWYSPRQRYIADSLLLDLKRRIPASADKIIGLTNKDISTEKGEIKNYGIMGLGFVGGKSCVVSTFRLHKNNASESLFKERYIKVIVHEIGHTLGLDHCPTANCIMQDCKGTIKTIDKESANLCSACKTKASICWNVR